MLRLRFRRKLMVWFSYYDVRLLLISKFILNKQQMRDSNIQSQSQESVFSKIRRSLYLIVSISLLTHTFSLVYSLLTFKEQSAAFISIIVSSATCFFVSSSHLTVYGISVLGSLYIKMIQPHYTNHQIFYTVAASGVIILTFWKPVRQIGSIFHCLPGKIHASMVFGIVLIVFSKFIPLAIENNKAFFQLSASSTLSSPFDMLNQLFSSFNVLTLVITVEALVLMFLMRGKLEKIPLIGIIVIIGIIINMGHKFKSYSDLCLMEGVKCQFHIINPANMKYPLLSQILQIIPAAIILAVVVLFQQFLYLQEFDRRSKRYMNQGSLGQVNTQIKTLAVVNLISGCLAGMPICINVFATYQNFAFNKRFGFKGTKWVGMLQIPFSYLLYTELNSIFTKIPMFVLFILVATPVIYFIKNVLYFHWRNLPTILIIALISAFTHPTIALIVACFVSIYEISELLKPAPAQMMIENRQSRLSSIKSVQMKIVQKNEDEDTRNVNQFVNHIIQIEDEIPEDILNQYYVIYRFIGSISFMNFYQHLQEMTKSIAKYCKNQDSIFVISLRYSQIIDTQSLNQLAIFTQNIREKDIRVIFTGLHDKIIKQMQQISYFTMLLQEQQKCMYSINTS